MEKRVFSPSAIHEPIGYSHVVATSGGTTVYVAGQVALDEGGEIVGHGDFTAQARLAFENLRQALAAAGASSGDVVRTGMYVVDLEPTKRAELREIRKEFFGTAAPPTSTLIGVAALARPELIFEIDAIAVID